MDLIALLQELDTLQKHLQTLRPLTPERARQLELRLRLAWNYTSNAIEGSTLSYSETKSFLLWGNTAKGKPFRDYLELKGHNEAVKRVFAYAEAPTRLTESLLKDFHRLILVEPYADSAAEINPGEYKKKRNYLYTQTGERIDFLAPSEVPEAVNALLNWVNNQLFPPKRKKNKYNLHPLLTAAAFHAQFVLIHPFGDGNGRLARLFTNLILMQAGYAPAIFPIEAREEYYAILTESSLEAPETLAVFLAEYCKENLKIAIEVAEGKHDNSLEKIQTQFEKLQERLNAKGEE